MDTELYLVNVYAPSGRNKEQERENLFETELTYQLIPNTDNIIMCGDWNSVLVPKDTLRPENACYSKALQNIITTFRYKDIFTKNKRKANFTFYMRNYASRLDRIYLSKLFSKIEDTVTYPVSFSDHLCVCVTLDIAQNIQLSRPRWRLNVSLLKTDIIKENFNIIWFHIQRRKQMFPNLIDWWEIMAKPQFKQFYIHQGKEQKRLSQGLTIYYEKKLRTLYEKANNENVLDYEKIKQIKNKIDSYREKKQ
ncbi:unnamed protein product [Meganyctiphanes norvegica]|uniref:Endonuclease/exonuclease/phosphatase domain-containing protein n=1 Tax=Meganyctiphanes norvegica TaxID=48144 RepID=A0AAV2SIA9_MEGNR